MQQAAKPRTRETLNHPPNKHGKPKMAYSEYGRWKRGPYLRWTPHPVIVTIRDNRDYIRVLLYSYYTTITGWGVLLNHISYSPNGRHSLLDMGSLLGDILGTRINSKGDQCVHCSGSFAKAKP